MKVFWSVALIFSVCLSIFSCNSESGSSHVSDGQEFSGEADYPDSLKGEAGETQIFVLPTPIQIATILKTYDFSYNGEVLLPDNVRIESHGHFEKALNLGMYSVDLSYAAVFNQRQQALNYVNIVKHLMDDLAIEGKRKEMMVQRFEKNFQDPDSVSKIILESYQESHNYFRNNEREGIGLLILTGCFIEGLYLSTHVTHIPDRAVYNTMIAQQKLFLNNIIELLGYYRNSGQVLTLMKDLEELKMAFDEVKVDYTEEGEAIRPAVTKSDIFTIRKKATTLRNKMVK